MKENNKIIIPEESIRIRVIGNSNEINDQLIKYKIKNNIEQLLSSNMIESSSIKEAKNKINNKKNLINNTIETNLINTNYSYKINYGLNYFPEKEYKGIKYKSGYYDSVVITLGEGKGNNWWCVLFPPLCLIDIKQEDKNNVEYKSKVLEILNKYN